MLKIGIVGSDNSHAIAYSKLINVMKVTADKCRVVGLWGQEEARTQEVAAEGQIETIVDQPEDLVDLVDVAIVVDRHGGLHMEHALPFIEKGTPVYVDKPFAVSLADCRTMLAASEKSGSLLLSGSPLRYAPATTGARAAIENIGDIKIAHFAGPCDFDSQYGGAFFYATHVVEVATRLLDDTVESLRAIRHGKNVAVQLIWKKGTLASFSYLGEAQRHYHVSLFGTEGMVEQEIMPGYSNYIEVLKALLFMIETGVRPVSEELLLHPVAVVEAIVQSLANDGALINLSDVLDA